MADGVYDSMHHLAPVNNKVTNEEIPAYGNLGKRNHAKRLAQQERAIMNWVDLWRAVILSSLDKTLYPYCHYIRTLDLSNLERLMSHSKFGGSACQ